MKPTAALVPVVFIAAVSAGCSSQPSPTAQPEPDRIATRAGPASDAYKVANEKMHMSMSAPMSGDPDIDFARQMIPHHQTAVTMAEIQLKYGHNPELRQLARDVIASQKTEVAQMQDWLKRNDRSGGK